MAITPEATALRLDIMRSLIQDSRSLQELGDGTVGVKVGKGLKTVPLFDLIEFLALKFEAYIASLA